MNYGKAIKTIRASRGLTQAQLGKATSLEASFISMVESNKRSPSTDALNAFSDAFGVPVVLITLLASEDDDLKSIDAKTTQFLGEQLVGVLAASTPSKRTRAAAKRSATKRKSQ